MADVSKSRSASPKIAIPLKSSSAKPQGLGSRSVSAGTARWSRMADSVRAYAKKQSTVPQTSLSSRSAQVSGPEGVQSAPIETAAQKMQSLTRALSSSKIDQRAKRNLAKGVADLFIAGKLLSRTVYGDVGLQRSVAAAADKIKDFDKLISKFDSQIIEITLGQDSSEVEETRDPELADFLVLLKSMKSEMREMQKDLNAKKEEWQAQVDAHPRGAKSVKAFMDKFTQAGIDAIDKQIKALSRKLEATTNPKKQKKLEARIEQLNQTKEKLNLQIGLRPDRVGTMSAEAFNKKINEHKEVVKKELEKCGISEKAFKKAFENVLNMSSNIDTVRSEVSFFHDGVASTYECETMPASQMPELANYYDWTGHTYVSSVSTKEAQHAVNLNVSRMRDSSGRLVSAHVRSGACSAYGISSNNEREKAGEERATEVITASFATALEKNPKLMKEVRDSWETGEPVDFTHVSVTMLNPGRIMSVLRKIIPAGFMRKLDERGQLNDHLKAMRAMEELGGKGELWIPVKMDDGSVKMIKVKPKVISLNFPTHSRAAGGVKKLAYVGMDMFENYRKMNENSLKKLIGDLTPGSKIGGMMGERLVGLAPDSPEAIEIKDLCEQVRLIWSSKSYRDMSDDPFQMVARLTNLAGMATDTGVSIHCSSGKDRTGGCDAEARFLKQQASASGGRVIEPGYAVEDDEEMRANYQQAMLATHQDTVQERCTGIAGSKTKKLKGLDKRMGALRKDEDAREARDRQLGGESAAKV